MNRSRTITDYPPFAAHEDEEEMAEHLFRMERGIPMGWERVTDQELDEQMKNLSVELHRRKNEGPDRDKLDSLLGDAGSGEALYSKRNNLRRDAEAMGVGAQPSTRFQVLNFAGQKFIRVGYTGLVLELKEHEVSQLVKDLL